VSSATLAAFATSVAGGVTVVPEQQVTASFTDAADEDPLR
jgi:hypothetical protein